ncbi:hypothetical protein PENTCL1PPCAC_28565, partial [Pristionchus entomophagus]
EISSLEWMANPPEDKSDRDDSPKNKPSTSSKRSLPSKIDEPSTSQTVDNVMDDCAICFDQIPMKDACYSTKCTHVFDKNCLMTWLANNRSCPSCRTPVERVRMKTGKNVPLPPMAILDADDPLAPEPVRLDDEAFINAELSSPEASEEDSDFEHEDERRTARRPAVRRATRSTVRIAPSSSSSRREAMISGFANLIAGGVGAARGASRRLRVALVDDNSEDDEPIVARPAAGRRRRPIARASTEVDEAPAPAVPRRRGRVIEDEDEEMEPVVQRPRERQSNRRIVSSSSSGAEEENEEDEEDSGSEESDSNTDVDSDDESVTGSSELDESVLEDQPSTSRQMIPVVRKKRTAKKKKATTKKRKTTVKKTEGGTVKKRKTKRRKSTKKAKRGTKRTRSNREEVAEQRQRMRIAFPSLSLNGADIDPLSADEGSDEPPVKRVRIPCPEVAVPSKPPHDPLDLLGSILTDQVVALAPGRHLEQKDGKLVPRETFSRHIERMERRGILPVSRAEVAPTSDFSTLNLNVPTPDSHHTTSSNAFTKASDTSTMPK